VLTNPKLQYLFCSLHIAYAQDNNVDTFKRTENTGQLLKVLEAASNVDSLKEMLTTNINNETRAVILFQLTTFYIDNSLDSSLKYIKLFNNVPSKSKLLEANGLVITGDIFLRLGNAPMAVELLFKGSQMMEALKDSAGMGMAYWNLGKLYQSLDDYTKAAGYYLSSVKIVDKFERRFTRIVMARSTNWKPFLRFRYGIKHPNFA